MINKISPAGIAAIKGFEGYLRPVEGSDDCIAYQEPGDRPTIGWGCTRGVTLGLRWTREQAERALAAELSIHEQRVNDIVTVPLTQGQFDALVSFDFNTGGLTTPSGLSTLTQLLNAGDYAGAARQFARWNKMGGTEIKGLTARRAKEAAMFLDEASLPMPQMVDTPIVGAKQLQQTSSKFSLALWLQRMFAPAGVGALGLVSQPDLGSSVSAISAVATAAKNNGLLALGVACLVVVIFLEVFKAKTVADAEDGRYTPSKEATKAAPKEAKP